MSFETRDVMVPTTTWVQNLLATKRGGWVHGGTGTGKSHAVRAALKGGIRIDVAAGPLLGQRFLVDLARQLGAGGQQVLEAVRHEGLAAALSLAMACVGTTPLVVDAVEHLMGASASLEDPTAALWQEDRRTVLDSLKNRLEQTPTILIGRGRPESVESSFFHPDLGEMPITLSETAGAPREWSKLARLARNNPAALTLARALVPVIPAADFKALVEQASAEDLSNIPLLQRLGEAFQSNAPPSWQKVLAILAALGGVPHDVLEPLLAERVRGVLVERVGRAGARVAPSEERTALDRLRELQLVEERAGLLVSLSALVSANAIPRLAERDEKLVLSTAAHALLAPINDPRSLEPRDADRVFRAHALYVELGDLANAERTAQLHVHGLVALARRTSVQKHDYTEAFQQYHGLLRMLDPDAFCTSDRAGKRLVSYVRHYRAWNGALAGRVDDATCLEEYTTAMNGWPENALWHQRIIEVLIRLGRVADARRAVDDGELRVDPHPRRDELLRVYPARVALRSKASCLLSLWLIEPLLELPTDLNPEVADGCQAVLDRWEQGFALSELPFPAIGGDAAGQVVLHEEADVSVRRASGPGAPSEAKTLWVARLPAMAREGRAETPRAAMEAMAHALAGDTRRLVSTPSSRLGSKDQRLKGHLLSVVDVLNSDVGLAHATDRWIVGRVEGTTLVPTMRDLPWVVQIPEALLPRSTAGLYFVKMPILRDGSPAGPATEVQSAGHSLSPDALLTLLAKMSEAS